MDHKEVLTFDPEDDYFFFDGSYREFCLLHCLLLYYFIFFYGTVLDHPRSFCSLSSL